MKKADGECLKFVSPGRRGVHDRICIFPNRIIVFVETKSTTGKLRPEQRRFHARMEKLKVRQEVIRTKAQAKAMVQWYS